MMLVPGDFVYRPKEHKDYRAFIVLKNMEYNKINIKYIPTYWETLSINELQKNEILIGNCALFNIIFDITT